jgi:hypothetical protein
LFRNDLNRVLGLLIAFSYTASLSGRGAGVLITDTLLDGAAILVLPLAILVLLAALSSLV